MRQYRNTDIEELAPQLRMDYAAKDDWGLIHLLTDFRLFRRGYGKRITNVLSMKDSMLDFHLRIFDYKFVVGAGNSTRRISQTVFFVDSKKLGLPHFSMQPEIFFHKIGQHFGLQDLDFEAYPAFSDQYLLRGEDESLIRSTMSKDMLQFFTLEKYWSLEGMNYYFIFYKWNKILPVDQVYQLHKKGLQLFEMLKDASFFP
ncbi:MAG: hypothetical protein KDC85_17830 [Saprospiraceae bacterium]|nr:hypothetical protein [Saprospiraceae bacterium]MCB9325314.1 hypothetical protein [Lewinellaceae bacterium]